MKKNIIVFSFNRTFLEVIEYRLHFYFCKTLIATTPEQFWSKLYKNDISFIIIDGSIASSFDLFFFCKQLKISSQVPILLISEKNYALESSFFDINETLLKPFSLRSLDLKILSLLKVTKDFKKNYVLSKRKELYFYNNKNKVSFNSSFISVTKTEFKILSLIVSQGNFLCHKSVILSDIWGYNDAWSLKSNIVEMHISKLKKKLISFFLDEYFLRKKGEFFLFSFYIYY